MRAKKTTKIKVKNSISAAHSIRGSSGSGVHNNRNLSVKRGCSRKIKHKNKYCQS